MSATGMPADVWKRCADFVKGEMEGFIENCVTPLVTYTEVVRDSDGEVAGFGEAVGSGSYLTRSGSTYLLTNEHVITKALEAGRVAYLPAATAVNRRYRVLERSQIHTNPWPVDMAIACVPLDSGDVLRPAIPFALLDEKFEPADRELLFFIGFPGSPLCQRHLRQSLPDIFVPMGGHGRGPAVGRTPSLDSHPQHGRLCGGGASAAMGGAGRSPPCVQTQMLYLRHGITVLIHDCHAGESRHS